ncbi:MAG: hypothetical protein LBU85_08870 [Treponema sp.]|jgi:hypothetical protein|nr:hypothetical protein [Treponema sp.]
MEQIGTFTPDNLLAGDFPRVTRQLAIPAGSLKRGTVVTSAGAAMATGGDPYAVLAEDVNASGGAVKAPVYLTGEFAGRHLILGGSGALSAGDIAKLRSLSIFVKDTVPAA